MGREHLLQTIVDFLAELRIYRRGIVGELADRNGFGFDRDGSTREGIASSAATEGGESCYENEGKKFPHDVLEDSGVSVFSRCQNMPSD